MGSDIRLTPHQRTTVAPPTAYDDPHFGHHDVALFSLTCSWVKHFSQVPTHRRSVESGMPNAAETSRAVRPPLRYRATAAVLISMFHGFPTCVIHLSPAGLHVPPRRALAVRNRTVADPPRHCLG